MVLALDSSSPSMVKGTTTPATTASFSPPAGTLLFALCEADEINTFAVSNTGTSLTWTSIGVSTNASGQGSIQVYWAYNAVAQSNITVSSARTGSFTANALKVLVFTGAETSFTGAKAAAFTATVNVTTTAANSWVWAAHIEENGGADTAATGCSFNDAETSFGGIGGGVLKRTANTPTSGTVVTIGVVSGTLPAIVAFEVKENPVSPVGAVGTEWHPGRGPGSARFYKTPRSTDSIQAATVTLPDPTVGGIVLSGSTDTAAIGSVVTDSSVGGVRLGDTIGETAVNSVVLIDPGVGGARSGGNTDTVAVGVALTDPSAGGSRLGGNADTSAAGIVLADTASGHRLGSTADALATGIVLTDASVGGSRAGDTFGETATAALSISDPSVGGVRAGSTTGTMTFGIVLTDTPGAATSGSGRETLATGIVLLDVISATRSGSTTDTLAVGTVLTDLSAGGVRAGTVPGETATSALPLTDPTVGGIRLGGTTGSTTISLAVTDVAGGIRLGNTVDTVRAGLVLTDVAGAVRLGSSKDALSLILPTARGQMNSADRATNTMHSADRPTARMEPVTRLGPTMKGG